MGDWQITSFSIGKTVTETSISLISLPNYDGQIAAYFADYDDADVDLSVDSLYYKAPEDYLRNQINSYGSQINYVLTYSGYEFEGKCRHAVYKISDENE